VAGDRRALTAPRLPGPPGPEPRPGSINDALNSAVPGAISQVQKVLDAKLALLAAFTFSTMYYLPGSGTASQGDHSENADTDLAVAVLP
jgi:hypothetical protein